MESSCSFGFASVDFGDVPVWETDGLLPTHNVLPTLAERTCQPLGTAGGFFYLVAGVALGDIGG